MGGPARCGGRRDSDLGATALLALLFAYSQWRAARSEISLDKFYERLRVPNDKLDSWPHARAMMNPAWARDSGRDRQRFEEAMYAFTELDNLEYAVEKYKLGYMEPEHALRCLRTFRSRCHSSAAFRCLALHFACGSGYAATTVEVVRRVCHSYSCEEREWLRTQALHRLEGAQPQEVREARDA